MAAFAVAAVVLAELWPPAFSQRRMVAYLVTMIAVVVAIISAALELQQLSATRNARIRVERS